MLNDWHYAVKSEIHMPCNTSTARGMSARREQSATPCAMTVHRLRLDGERDAEVESELERDSYVDGFNILLKESKPPVEERGLHLRPTKGAT